MAKQRSDNKRWIVSDSRLEEPDDWNIILSSIDSFEMGAYGCFGVSEVTFKHFEICFITFGAPQDFNLAIDNGEIRLFPLS